ncbi:hypothetical protein IFR05_007238, partial [Cadophora sp. M221]
MSNQATHAAISNIFNLPPYTWEVSPVETSEEYTRLYRISLAIAIFVFSAWVTEKMGWWSHAISAEILQQNDEDRRQDRENEIERRMGEGGYLHPDANQDEIDEQDESELEREREYESEYHIQPTPALWTLIKFSFVIFIILSRHNISFSNFTEYYSFLRTWMIYLTFMFREASFGGVEKAG